MSVKFWQEEMAHSKWVIQENTIGVCLQNGWAGFTATKKGQCSMPGLEIRTDHSLKKKKEREQLS